MTTKERLLVINLLRGYSEMLSNTGCNDWDFPDDWTEEEKRTFLDEYDWYNSGGEERSENIPDYAVASFLAHRLAERR